MTAAVRLVTERGTTAVPVTDLADAADVTRKLLYLHFGDRDGLLVAAAADLVERELVAQAARAAKDLHAQVLVAAGHFAEHQAFYRPMPTGSCAFAMARTLNGVFGSLNRATVRDLFGALDEATVNDVATFFAGGASAVVHDWLIDGADPLVPGELADRLLCLASVITPHQP
ncbi:TetR/AcrR family transcriptional regulator [Streptomyces sp. NPDC001100]